jgi:hypothetical protein
VDRKEVEEVNGVASTLTSRINPVVDEISKNEVCPDVDSLPARRQPQKVQLMELLAGVSL